MSHAVERVPADAALRNLDTVLRDFPGRSDKLLDLSHNLIIALSAVKVGELPFKSVNLLPKSVAVRQIALKTRNVDVAGLSIYFLSRSRKRHSRR